MDPVAYPLLTTLNATDKDSILALKASDTHLFAGTQAGSIDMWSLAEFSLKESLRIHSRAVLALELAPERSWLFSSSADGTVSICDSKTLTHLYTIHAVQEAVGDIFCLAWSTDMSCLYFGCQDTSIISMKLQEESKVLSQREDIHTPHPHPFFDSTKNSSRVTSPTGTPKLSSINSPDPSKSVHHKNLQTPELEYVFKAISVTRDTTDEAGDNTVGHLYVDPDDIYMHAHHGYIYSMVFTKPTPSLTVLATGSGDEKIKVWACSGSDVNRSPGGHVLGQEDTSKPIEIGPTTSSSSYKSNLKHIATLQGCTETAVLTLVAKENLLFAGHQGGTLQVWDLETFSCLRTLNAHSTDIMSLSITHSNRLFSLCADGLATGWSKSFSPLVTWKAHTGICLTSTTHRKLSSNDEAESVQLLFSGGNDHCIRVWKLGTNNDDTERRTRALSINAMKEHLPLHQLDLSNSTNDETEGNNKFLEESFIYRNFEILEKFIGFKSISVRKPVNPSSIELDHRSSDVTTNVPTVMNSGNENNINPLENDAREECRQAASFLRSTLEGKGAEAELITGVAGSNNLVLATFHGNSKSTKCRPRKRVLYYGHYDVVKPGAEDEWKTDPFKLVGQNGYLIARGVSDNKGPILAVADAAAMLQKHGELDIDVVMIIEGEEESGSTGFQEVIQQNSNRVGKIDAILICNSYWIGEDIPCIVWGMRGLMQATVEIFSRHPDCHSGMHGGSITNEPLVELTQVLSGLLSDGQKKERVVAIDGFYDDIRNLGDDEEKRYLEIMSRCSGDERERLLKRSDVQDLRQSLVRRWREPTLSIHKIQVSGPSHSTVIPHLARATVSIRLVPDQNLSKMRKSITEHIQHSFSQLNSTSTLSVRINDGAADYWIGNPQSVYSKCMASSIQDEWNMEPLWVREGGSIPPLSFLTKCFGAEAVHLPMGQASDSAHLPNERIRTVNLERGRNVILRWMSKIAEL